MYMSTDIMCLPPITNGNGHINPRFFFTFPGPKNTMVKELFMKKKFVVCKRRDLYG